MKSKTCEICHRGPIQANMGRHLNSGKWRHRGPETARKVFLNIQKIEGIYMCTTCLRTLNKQKSLSRD